MTSRKKKGRNAYIRIYQQGLIYVPFVRFGYHWFFFFFLSVYVFITGIELIFDRHLRK